MAVATIKDLLDPLTKIQATSQSSADSLDAISVALGAQVQGDEAILRKLDLLIAGNTPMDYGGFDSAVLGRLDILIESMGGSKLNVQEVLKFKNEKEQTKLLRIIAAGKKDGAGAAGGGKDNKSLKEGAMALKALGAGAGTLAKGLIIFNFVPKKAIGKFKETLFDLYETISNFKTKDLKEGAEGFQIMASSIGTFAKNLALSAILLPIGLVGVNLLKTA